MRTVKSSSPLHLPIDWKILIVLDMLGASRPSFPSSAEIISAARMYLNHTPNATKATPQELFSGLASKVDDIVGKPSITALKINQSLFKWSLFETNAIANRGREWNDATSQAVANFHKCICDEDTISLIDILIALSVSARTFLDYLDPNTIAAIAEGKWQGKCPEKINRVVFRPTTAPSDLLIAKMGSVAENQYLDDPKKYQASSVMTNRPERYPEVAKVLKVPNTLRSTALLAHHARRHASGRFIAITGSSGKTSTKEMINYALRRQMLTFKTFGSSNSIPVIAHSLIQVPLGTAASVFECGLGANGSGISDMSSMIRSHTAVVTSVGPAHLAGYGTVEKIALCKLEIARYLEPDGCLLIDGDSYTLRTAVANSPFLEDKTIYTIGFGIECDIRVSDCEVSDFGTHFKVDIFGELHAIKIALLGRHWAKMAATALAVAVINHGNMKDAISGIQEMTPQTGRGQLVRLTKNSSTVLIFDSHYNANPGSMLADLEAYLEIYEKNPRWRKYAIVGAYKEIGDRSEYYHAELLRTLATAEINRLILIGVEEFANAKEILDDNRIDLTVYSTIEQALPVILKEIKDNDYLFIKGSHSNNLALVTPYLTSNWT